MVGVADCRHTGLRSLVDVDEAGYPSREATVQRCGLAGARRLAEGSIVSCCRMVGDGDNAAGHGYAGPEHPRNARLPFLRLLLTL
jgi:hypothetical protein